MTSSEETSTRPNGANDTSDAQADIYQTRADEYDALINAEDADGNLRRHLLETHSLEGAVIADIGAGTGRLARWMVPVAQHVHLVERAEPMLAVARERLKEHDHCSFYAADARAIPLADDSVDIAMAGWVFGHFRHWMPDGWQAEVDTAMAEMRRIVRPGSPVVVIETLGTGHETPREHVALDEYFDHLTTHHGMTRQWFRTDYRFPTAEKAAAVLGGFFGEEMATRIIEKDWARVPECTAVMTWTP